MAIGKVLLGTGLTAFVGLGVANMGFYLERESWDLMPYWKPLSEDANFSTYEEEIKSGKKQKYTGNYGETYAKYLVGVDGTYNDKWWSWSGRTRFLLIADAEIIPGYPGNETVEKMKAGCRRSYAAEKNKVKPNTIKSNEYNEEMIWFLCSPGGSKPKSISQVDKNKYSSTANSYGHSTDHNTKLIDVDDSTNNWFWDIQNKEYEKTKTTSPLASISENNIKGWCKSAYSKTKPSDNTNGEFSESNVYKWCSLEGKKEQAS